MGFAPRLLSVGPLIAVVLLFNLVPARANQCIVGCHGMRTSKSYVEGHTYSYDFDGISVTSVSQAEGDSTVKLKAVVELSVKPDCIHQIKLKNVRVNGAPVTQSEVEKHSIQFNYHDGHIDTSICTEPGDTQNSLNIKRAIVSLFQSAILKDNGVTTHRETDVFGSCPTEFEYNRDGDILTVHKSRNLARCSHRESMRHGLINAIYDDSSNIKSSPVLNSHQQINQIFTKGVLNSAKSTETYSYRPFANGDAGAKTIVQSSLTFISDKADGSSSPPVSLSKSLVFDPPHPVTESSSSEAIINAVKMVKSQSGPDVIKNEAAEKFGSLIKILKRSTKDDILNCYRKVKSGDGGFDKNSDRKILLDALYRTGSGDAAEVIAELIKNKEVSGVQSLAFYASLALIDHVSLPSVTAVASLLDQPNLPRIGYLGIGRVIGKYCQQHDCENVGEINAAIGKINGKIGNGKSENREQENIVIAALKAIRNCQYINEDIMKNIVTIVKDKTVSSRVRVAAIESLTAKCSMKWKTPIIDVFGDLEEDSEIRIKAYLSLVQCSCPQVANAIKKIIDAETVNQVGSFVKTHLRNLRASTDPNKQNAKYHLGEIKPLKKFPEDFRKFSFNHEFSYNIDALGIGSSAEQNVIYSQKSFVPRSISMNLTTELFGRSFNFLEIDARAENVDRLIEHYFGPKGIIKREALSTLLMNTKAGVSGVYDHIKERAEKSRRGRRNVIEPADLEKFAKTAKPKPTEIDDDLDIDLSLRLFGVELAYIDLRDNSASNGNPNLAIDRIFDFIDRAFKQMKDFDYNYSKHMHIIDVDLIYPTGLGFPLSVGVEGNGVIHVKANGKLDVPAIINDPTNAAIKIGLEPSANIAIIASLTIETFGIESGLKVISRLHTATGSDLSITILNGKGIDISLGVPKKKQEIISVSSQVILINDKENIIEPKFPKGKEHADCFDQFSTTLGLTVCGHFSYPYESIESLQKTPIFPLTGPSKFAITIENNDATSFHFRTYYDTSIDHQRSFEAIFDTPNSRTNRKVALRIEGANKPIEKYIKATLHSPFKAIDGKILLENSEQKKVLTLTLNHDSDKYSALIGLIANGNKYKPILEYKIPDHIEKLAGGKGSKGGGKPVYKLDGDITIGDEAGGHKYTFDKITLHASGKKLASLDGYITAKPDALIIDTKLSHNDESLSVKFDGKKTPTGFDINAAAIPSKDPSIGFKTIWHYDLSNNILDNKLEFIYGADLESEIQRLTFIDRLEYKKNEVPNNPYGHFSAVNYKSEVKWPAQELLAELDMKLDINKKSTLNSFETEFDIKYGTFKCGSEFEIKLDENASHNWEIGFETYVLDNKFLITAKHQKLSDYKRKFEGKCELPNGGKYEIELLGNYQRDEPQNVDIKFNGNVKINGKSLKLDYGLDTNPEKIDSHAIINFENTKYLDFLLKLKRGNNPHGNLNLNLQNLLSIIGQFDYQQGKGAGNIVIDLPKFERKVKATGDITVTGIRHVANIEILLNADKDPSKYIKLSTDSEIKHDSINSKNNIELFSYKTEFNVDGYFKDKKQDGYQFEGNAHITLPNGHYIVTKGKQLLERKSDKTNIHCEYELIDYPKKGGQSRNLAYKGEASFTPNAMESPRYEFNVQHELKLINLKGEDIKFNFGSNNAKTNDEKQKNEIHILASGSYLPKTFTFDFNVDHVNKHHGSVPHEAMWKLKSTLGNDLSVVGDGKYYNGMIIDKPRTTDINLDFALPYEKLRNLKYQGSTSVHLSENDNGKFDYTCSQSLTYNDDKNIKINGELHHSGFQPNKKKNGSYKVTFNVLAYPPMTVETSFEHDPTDELKNKGSVKLNVNYGDKSLTADIDSTYQRNLNDVELNIKANIPAEKLRSIKFGFVHKYDGAGIRKCNTYLVADDKKYELTSEFEINPSIHRINVFIIYPTGKSEFLAKIEKLSDTEFKAEAKIDSPKGLVNFDTYMKADNIDNFVIQVNFDCDEIKYRKIHVDIKTTPGVKSGKRIVLTVTSDGKNIITGSTSYSKRDEAGQMIVEGNGSIKIGETTARSSRFTYSRKKLTRESDGETGVAMLLNANFGPSAVVGELKLSDKEVLVFNSYCEQSKDCALFKLQGTLKTDHDAHLDHQIIVEVDLKKFNVPVEFGLKSTNKYHPKELTFDHSANLYLHTSKDKTEYSSQIYTHPKDSAIILTLPSRELALIATIDVPKSKTPIGQYNIELSAYLDRKNRPTEKTSLVVSGDVNIENNAADVSSEIRFIYPSQSTKDMVVKSKVHYGGNHLFDAHIDFDVFAKKAQKIVVTTRIMKNTIPRGYNVTGDLEIHSNGQQLKVNLKQHLAMSANEIGFGSILSYTDVQQKLKTIGMLFSADTRQAHLLVQAPDQDLIKLDTIIELNNNLQKINSEIALFENPPIVVGIEAHDMNSFKYQAHQKDKPDTKLVVTGRAIIAQVVDIHADVYKNGEKKELFNVGIYLDESRFFKPNLNYDKSNVAEMIDFYRDRIVKYTGQIKEAGNAIGNEARTEFKDLFDHLKKSQINWKPIIQYYQNELQKLEEELNADTTIKEIQATINKVFGPLIKTVTKILNEFAERMGELNKQYREILEKIVEAMEATYPHIKESIDKISQAGVEIIEAASKLTVTYLKTILAIINEHQKDIKELVSAICDIANDITKILVKGYNEIEGELKNIIKLIAQQIQTLPSYDWIKEKYMAILNYQLPNAVLAPIEEAFVQFKRVLPTEELREFFTVVYNYILKHIKREKIDDGTEIKKIYTHGIDAIQSIIQLLQSHGTFDIYNIFGIKLQGDFDYLKNLPGIPILKISLLNLLKNREVPSIIDIYYAYRPTLYPSDLIPPFSKTGIVVEGGHFFTYDGRHLTMAGNCDYVLSQDTRDGNFSIVGSFNNGKLISITVTAPGESITLKSNGNILVDNKPADYPASTKNLHAFFTLPIVNVKSDYGLHIACTQKTPMICSVHVSGFYHGKLRGIFGDANNEPYDDFVMPTGHITDMASEFGNAYRLNSGCEVAPKVDHHSHNRNPTCTEYFSGNSIMRSCFNYVDPSIYREACDHATGAGTPNAACLISTAYYTACRKERVLITVPTACGGCKVGKNEISIGDSFSVKIPKKEADIIFVVEQETKNEKIFKELITPLIAEVKSELSQHGITDVNIGLIGYGEHLKWPQHYTTNGNLNIVGPVKHIEFAPNNPQISFKDAKEGDFKTRIKYAGQRLNVELGRFKLTDAYEEAVRYPFRAGAAKAVVGVISSPCEKSPLPVSLQQLRLLMGRKVYHDLGLIYYHIGYLDDVLVSGKPQKNVVGYDAQSGYTFNDSKKKPLDGSIDKNNLVLTSDDVCAGFAVSSGGAVFSSDHFLDGKPNQKKQFIQITARRLANGLTDTEINEDCICTQQYRFDGSVQCKIIARKEKESLAKHSKSGVKG